MTFSRFAIIYVLAHIAVSGCSKEETTSVAPPPQQQQPSIEVGGLYATLDKDGSWRIVKVLALDEQAVHLRSYANKFPEEPKDLDPAVLTMGGLNDPAGFGIGHFPLAREGFFNQKRVLIKVLPVKEDELDGYKLYLEAMKGGDQVAR